MSTRTESSLDQQKAKANFEDYNRVLTELAEQVLADPFPDRVDTPSHSRREILGILSGNTGQVEVGIPVVTTLYEAQILFPLAGSGGDLNAPGWKHTLDQEPFKFSEFPGRWHSYYVKLPPKAEEESLGPNIFKSFGTGACLSAVVNPDRSRDFTRWVLKR